MKYSIVILLVLVSLIATMQDSFTLLVFKINQDYIAKTLCIQKDIEDNSCQGCCQLKKQMEQQNEQEESNPNQSREKLLIDFFPLEIIKNQPGSAHTTIRYKELQCQFVNSFISDVFHPPQKRLM
ncbi:hypothetical protein KDU71_14600 [Carboxylicivirga sediminis]|uniref:Uncharacterized protein n=1 Tax=Carboxylicivirga sediminis TaxID=2006564 RepID=A0A941F4S4_9BACT|nr:hypothetical protein [Carboxylicivirga sediminis]MBR8536801.1 hypothetical protein [Carboxylicivirga sediminis]